MEAPGVEHAGSERSLAEFHRVSRVPAREPTRENVEEDSLAGASMAQAITRAELLARLREAAQRLDADARGLANAVRIAADLLDD